jgi:hypothetical protein
MAWLCVMGAGGFKGGSKGRGAQGMGKEKMVGRAGGPLSPPHVAALPVVRAPPPQPR